jgi:hypothetical protein
MKLKIDQSLYFYSPSGQSTSFRLWNQAILVFGEILSIHYSAEGVAFHMHETELNGIYLVLHVDVAIMFVR